MKRTRCNLPHHPTGRLSAVPSHFSLRRHLKMRQLCKGAKRSRRPWRKWCQGCMPLRVPWKQCKAACPNFSHTSNIYESPRHNRSEGLPDQAIESVCMIAWGMVMLDKSSQRLRHRHCRRSLARKPYPAVTWRSKSSEGWPEWDMVLLSIMECGLVVLIWYRLGCQRHWHTVPLEMP